jgi:hypothetical protein
VDTEKEERRVEWTEFFTDIFGLTKLNFFIHFSQKRNTQKQEHTAMPRQGKEEKGKKQSKTSHKK